MSTIPALPCKESETLESESAVMTGAFDRCVALGYGAARAVRNLGFGIVCAVGAAQAETVTIAALGDSLTAGYGLDTAEGFVPQLQAWMDAKGVDVKIINAGVSGDTTAGGLSRTDWTLTDDVDGMIVALGANDYLRGLDPALARENIRGILEKAKARDVDVLLVGLVVGANYGLEYKQEFDEFYPELAEEFGTDFYPQWFAGILAQSGMEDGMGAFMQADGLHPNAEGVRVIVDAMGPSVLHLATGLES